MEAYRPLLSQNVLQAGVQSISEGQHPGRPLNIPRTRRPMIVTTRAARARGERRLPKFLFPTFPCRPEDVRKEEMKKQIVRKMKQHPSWARSWAWWKILHTTLWHAHKIYHMILFFRRGSASSSGCWNSQAKMPRNNWRDFQKQAFSLAFAYTPGPSRPRISQEASTSSSQADHAQLHGQQYPMHPPARPAPPTGGGFLELMHSQPTEMVSNFLIWSLLYGHFYMVIYIWSFCYVCKVSVINIIKFIRESVLLKHR